MLNKNIGELLEQNHALAAVMHWYGIDALSYLSFTLDEVCKIKNIDTRNLELELFSYENRNQVQFEKLKHYAPSDLCKYLLNNHHNYAQRLLPVIDHHINQTCLQLHHHYPQLRLLANIFETFKSDFLKHINYENEKVFPYIKNLEKYTVNFHNSLLIKLKNFSIQDFIFKHHHDDDEMHNIRKLLKNYHYDLRDALPYRILMNELRAFEADLKVHSKIEEELLIPMALRLEKKLMLQVETLVKVN